MDESEGPFKLHTRKRGADNRLTCKRRALVLRDVGIGMGQGDDSGYISRLEKTGLIIPFLQRPVNHNN